MTLSVPSRFTVVFITLLLTGAGVTAQTTYRHTMITHGLVGAESVDVESVEVDTRAYSRRAGDDLPLDIYRPKKRGDEPLPVVVMAAITRAGSIRERAQYVTWAEAIAARGLAAVVFDSEWDSGPDDVADALATLRSKGDAWGLRSDRVGAFACSGNVFGLYDTLIAPANGIHCAALYYGAPAEYASPGDVAVLVTSAGRDAPALNERIAEYVTSAVNDGCDVEWIHDPTSHHAFDVLDDTPRTRATIARTIQWYSDMLNAPADVSAPLDLRKAVAHFEYQEWPEAALAYRAHLERHADDARGWFRLGVVEVRRERFAEAAEPFERAAALGLNPADNDYNAACMHALAESPDKALDALTRAVDAGYSDAAHLAADEDLTSLRDNARFKALLARM